MSADPTSLEHVLHTIQAALSVENSVRGNAESLLRSWESDAAPGFLLSLLRIVEQHAAVAEPLRLLAAVIAKNAVGSSWRKTLGTREWSRVPDEEKHLVREAALSLLLSDPSERLATQLGLLIANIARFDFPGRSEDLLARLTTAASWEGTLPPASKLRALKALRRTLNGLTTKRFVIEQPKAGGQMTDLRMLSQQINTERELFRLRITEAFEPLKALFMRHCEAFIAVAPDWQMHGVFAKACVAALSELLYLSASPEELHPGTRQFLEQVHAACTAIMQGRVPLQSLQDPAEQQAWLEVGGRLHERMAACLVGYLDNFPVPFAEYVPHFLQLFVDSSLLALDAATVRSLRAKRRVLLVRFIAKALLSPFYRREWVDASIPEGVPAAQSALVAASKAKARAAHTALQSMLSPENGQVQRLVEAVISKYVALTQEELDEWQTDPESYVRSMDVESGPEADTPRPIGVGLLLCMLERGGEPVAQALLALAAQLQAQAGSAEAILMREAVYRCIGEGYNHVSSHVDFKSWYNNELSVQLSSRVQGFVEGTQDLSASVLQARSLWLLGVCGQDLLPDQWRSAYSLVAQHVASRDLVVALTAVGSTMALAALVLEDQGLLEQHRVAQRQANGQASVPSLMEAISLQETLEHAEQRESQGLIAEASTRVEQRLVAIVDTAPGVLASAFDLLSRLAEVESSVRVLQLVSVLVEVMGDSVRPHLGTIAAALPKVWGMASQHSSGATGYAASTSKAASASSTSAAVTAGGTGDTGAVVRLHSALIAVLTHLVAKLRKVAVLDPQIQSVVFPLLHFSTSLGTGESEVLVEEAFRLWSSTLSSSPEVPPPLLELLPHLAALLRRGKDNSSCFSILEAYLLLGGSAALQPYSPDIAQALSNSVSNVAREVVGALQGAAGGGGPAAAGGLNALLSPNAASTAAAPAAALSSEAAQEALAASALCDLMLQLFPSDVPTLLLPAFSSMAALVSHPSLPQAGVPTKVINVLEAFVEVLGRLFILRPSSYLELLSGSDPAAPVRFLDKWLTVASARFLEEIIGVKTMAMLGRYRRRIATVSLCALLASDGCPPAFEPLKAMRICSLAVQAVLDNAGFHSDQAEMDALDFKSDLNEDCVTARRLQITRLDVVRTIPVAANARAAVMKLSASMGGEAPFLAFAAQHAAPRLVTHITNLMTRGSIDQDGDRDNDDELLQHMGPSGTLSIGGDHDRVAFTPSSGSLDEDD